MKYKYQIFFNKSIAGIRNSRLFSHKGLTFEEINYNKGFREDAEMFSLIDPSLNVGLINVIKKKSFYMKLISIVPFRLFGK